MAIVIDFNPFQDNMNGDIVGEVIKTSAVKDRVQFVPRKAPFFSRGVKLYKKGSPDPLVLGKDYGFANPFDAFTLEFNRNCFGSVVLIGHKDSEIIMDYSTIGSPFILDEIAYNELVANILNNPRLADWSSITNVPTEFPSAPHDHPATQTYDYLEMMTSLRALLASITDNSYETTSLSLIKKHMEARLNEAHTSSTEDIGIPEVQNLAPAVKADLNGNSANKVVTVDVLMEAFRMAANGTLNFN